MTKSILAPYGSLKFLPIATKVGAGKGGGGEPTKPMLAPYGSLDNLPIATKVGETGKGG